MAVILAFQVKLAAQIREAEKSHLPKAPLSQDQGCCPGAEFCSPIHADVEHMVMKQFEAEELLQMEELATHLRSSTELY